MKGEQYVFLWRFLGFFKARTDKQDFVAWTTQVRSRSAESNSCMDVLSDVTLENNNREFELDLREDSDFTRRQDRA